MHSILLYLASINEYECSKLEVYVETREQILETHNITKYDVLKQMFSDKLSIKTTGWLREFKKEICELRKKINIKYSDYAVPSEDTKNPEGSALFGVLMYYENLILQKMMKKVV